MDIAALTLRDIQYLLAVAQHLHFGRAATACHVSQPALSAQVKKVEDQLGHQIFERSHKQIRITPLGERFLKGAREVWLAAERLALSTSRSGEPMTGTLRVGAIATLGPYYWPHVLAPLRRRYPKLRLVLREGLTDQLIGLLKDGELDGVLAAPTFDTQGLSEQPLFFEPFLAALPTEHPLAKKAALQSKDLNSEEMILLEDGHCLKDQALDLCPANRRGSIRQSHATSIETLRQLVATGMGYTLLPVLSVPKSGGMKGLLEYRPLASARMGRMIAFYSRKQASNRTDLDMLFEVLSQHLPSQVASL